MQGGREMGVIGDKPLRLVGKRRADAAQERADLRQLNDKLAGGEQLAFLIADHLFFQLRRDVRLFQPGFELFAPARNILGQRVLQAGKLFEKYRQLRRGQQRNNDLFYQLAFADSQNEVQRIRCQHWRACLICSPTS